MPELPAWTGDAWTILQGLVAIGVPGAIYAIWRFFVPELNIQIKPHLSDEVAIGDKRATSVRAVVSSRWGSVQGCTVLVTKYERWIRGSMTWRWMDQGKGRHQLRWASSATELAQDIHPGAPGYIVVAVAFEGEDELRSGAPDDQPILSPGRYRLTLLAAARASGDRVRRTTKNVILDWHGATAWRQIGLEEA